MKKVSKQIIVVLLSVVLGLQMIGCSSTEGQKDESSVSWTNVTEESAKAENNGESAVPKPEPIVMFPLQPTIEETVLYDQDNIRITAKDLTYSRSGAELSLLLENGTDHDLSFYSNTLAYACNSINGHMFSFGYISEDISAGSSAETSFFIYGDELALYGITDIADIELGFRITDADYNAIYTGPCVLKTSIADTYDYSVVSFQSGISDERNIAQYEYSIINLAQEIIYEQDDLLIRSEAIFKNKDDETIISLEVENVGTEMKDLTLGNIAVNGLTVEGGGWTTETINPGKVATLDFKVNQLLDANLWELAGITDFASVTFDLTQRDEEGDTVGDVSRIALNLSGTSSYAEGTEIFRSDYIMIVELGSVQDESKYSEDQHILLIVQNLYTEPIHIDDVFKSLKINGSDKGSALGSFGWLDPGELLLVDFCVYEFSFEKVGIETWEDVISIQIEFELYDESYDDLDIFTVELMP